MSTVETVSWDGFVITTLSCDPYVMSGRTMRNRRDVAHCLVPAEVASQRNCPMVAVTRDVIWT